MVSEIVCVEAFTSVFNSRLKALRLALVTTIISLTLCGKHHNNCLDICEYNYSSLEIVQFIDMQIRIVNNYLHRQIRRLYFKMQLVGFRSTYLRLAYQTATVQIHLLDFRRPFNGRTEHRLHHHRQRIVFISTTDILVFNVRRCFWFSFSIHGGWFFFPLLSPSAELCRMVRVRSFSWLVCLFASVFRFVCFGGVKIIWNG